MITSKILRRFNRPFLFLDVFKSRSYSYDKNVLSNTRFFFGVNCLTNRSKKLLPSQQSQICASKYCFKFNVDLEEENEEADDNYSSDEILTEEILKEVADGDPEIEKLLKVLEFEISIYREQELILPKIIKTKEWKELVKLESVTKRKKYLCFLGKNEIERQKKAQQQIESKALREIVEDFSSETNKKYGLGINSLLVRVYDKSLNKLFLDKLMGALMYYPPIVFDCSYDKYMSRVNAKYCAKQILSSYVVNRVHGYPIHVKCCNVDKNGITYEFLQKTVLNSIDEDLMWDIHEESYLDLFPKEKLVYLTPHTHVEMQSFNPDKIYIIGAFVDKGCGTQASLAKAKAEGLEMAKFPIDRYLLWKNGGKSLPLNTVMQILLDLRYHKKWENAFKNIPDRNLKMSKLQENYFKQINSFQRNRVIKRK